MDLRDKILSMRMNEFGLSKISFFGDPDKDVFPNRIHIVKWEKADKPYEAYSIDKKKKVLVREYCYAIGELVWNEHEPDWEFNSVGTRYLECATEELNKWILDFCNKYEVVDGEIRERELSDWEVE